MRKQANIVVVDANEAVADIAYRTNEICVIYPITPASQMGEWVDVWRAEHKHNVWNTVPDVVEMQSEGGAAGALHGVLQTGALATTFTSSQGLLLMIPNMYRIAGELTPTVFHVASRAVAPQGMTIYCDHSDVMATRATGFAILSSATVQEAHDMALLTQAISLKSRIPFLHFFDGFRTSHEVNKIERLTDAEINSFLDDELVLAHRERRMRTEEPCARGVVYNSDIFFQERESVSPFYDALADTATESMQRFKELTGREYKIMEYFGDPAAEKVIVIMGSAAETVRETISYLQEQREKVGLLQIRLFQPFSSRYFCQALPESCKAIAVLDRTKEPGAGGEPLYQKVATAILEHFAASHPKVIGGRYGIGSKEFTPAMVKSVFAELEKSEPRNNFTIGINDDVSHSSLAYDEDFSIEPVSVRRAIFYGLGSDGTVGANKNSIKIIGEETKHHVQGYFVYDARKSGARTVSHLRFSPDAIHASYLITQADFIGCHQFSFITKLDVLKPAQKGATLLLNSPYSAQETWERLPQLVQETIIVKQLRFYVIDAYKVATECKMGQRINTIMQTCFFALADILPVDAAIAKIKHSIEKTYATKGDAIVKQNFVVVDRALENLQEVAVPAAATSAQAMPAIVSPKAPAYVQNVIAKMLVDRGDELAVSEVSPDGTFPCQTTCWEKRNVAEKIPVWDKDKCVKCGRCSLVCPHAAIRAKKSDSEFMIQVYPEDCTGCGLCVENCPVKALELQKKEPILQETKAKLAEFESLPYGDREQLNSSKINELQFIQPMFEFCCACAGCGEASYVKLLTQLFGDRMLIANACGCSIVYGGNLPTIPWVVDAAGRGPAWTTSLFEDNAEFGFGFRITEDQHKIQAKQLLQELSKVIGEHLAKGILAHVDDKNEKEIFTQRNRIIKLKEKLRTIKKKAAKQLLSLADHLVYRSIWIIGGDGWAYDIGFGGVDHV
ncbi:MAG: pyruvate:ferredoxin (flavodoxin) oxidoreductase, partial [Gammaproteobacteria bacterium]|nr:pyruvate:ferredoxin (flavodoxin) oxidoreductase [Gammaproteobacteria bacterium]